MNKKLILASSLMLVLSACGGRKDPEPKVDPDDEGVVVPDLAIGENVINPDDYGTDYLKDSAKIYNNNYGKFFKAYEAANNAANVSERYAYQAIAEAKLLEGGTLLPGSANGGSYAISRVVPYTITPCNWGHDSYRYHDALLLKGNPLTKAERDACKAKYKELNDSGRDTAQAEYVAWVRQYFQGREFNRTYTQYYDGEPDTFDILNSYYATDSEPLVNTYDGLVEYDGMNQIKPALAESWSVSADGTEYTFNIRQGAEWVDKDGNKVADVQADDFVAGFQHMLDCASGLEFLVQGVVKNANEYLDGDVEFDQVGCKAEGNAVKYKLEKPVPYFMTMLSYSIFAPMSRSYYTSQGGAFGSAFDNKADTYQYAKDYDHIAYCGPYLVKTYVKENTFEFEKNAKYWNAANINIDKIVWLENDGSDPLKAYNGMKAGTVNSAGLNAQALEEAKKDGYFEQYAYVSGVDANTYPFYINLNRQAYANYNDQSKGISGKTAAEKELATKALGNVYIRLGLEFAIDRSKYYAVSKGEELALKSAVNSYTPGNFVKTAQAVTVKINGADKTFPAGTYYGAIMQAQIDADKLPMKVWDPEADGGLGSSGGYDGWFNAKNARAYFKKGVAALKAEGVEISAANPLPIELVTASGVEITDKQIKAMGQSIKAALGDLVNVKYLDVVDRATMLRAEYYPQDGFDTNCDIMTISGWGPDYGDPATYLDTFTPGRGGMLKCSGIF